MSNTGLLGENVENTKYYFMLVRLQRSNGGRSFSQEEFVGRHSYIMSSSGLPAETSEQKNVLVRREEQAAISYRERGQFREH